MNWGNFLWIFYFAEHTAAGIFDLVLELLIYGITVAGPWAWIVPGACMVLLGLDLSGRLSLRGSAAKLLAALAFPLLCSCGEMALSGSSLETVPPPVLAWVFALLLLAAYVLLREERRDSPLSKAEALLFQGSAMSVVETVWLMAIGGAVLFMCTFGLPFSLIIGGLTAARNSLLDYGGIKGLMAGLLVIYALQCLWFWRGARLVGKTAPELASDFPLFFLLVPFWNQAQAWKLARRLQMRDVKEYY